MKIRHFCLVFAFLAYSLPVKASDYLKNWNNVTSKKEIMDFVSDVSNPDSENYVEPADRIAVFDNDGTLWSEQPIYFQFYYALDQVPALLEKKPELKNQQPYKALVEGDLEAALGGGAEAILDIALQTHSGSSPEEFAADVATWLETRKHPGTGKLFTEMVFQPMLELLDYLRAHEFKTYIVSGGGIDFLRVWAEEVYGIPPEQIIGTSVKTELVYEDGKPVIKRLPELNFLDDKSGKPLAIQLHIGKRPLAAFGNSDGDLQMLQWTSAGTGPRFGLILHHTDNNREWAYDRKSHVGKLDKALDEAETHGWTIVDMKADWAVIYP